MAIRVNTVTVTTSPTLLARGGEAAGIIRIRTDADIFIGGDNVNGSTHGWPVTVGEADTADYDFGAGPQYQDDIYAVTASGTASVIVLQSGL